MTRLMVLGFLARRPMSGYEIQQYMQQSHADKWAGILPGSIYHALKKMEGEGLVEVDSVQSTGHRSKALYKITSTGEQEYRRLIEESLTTPSLQLPSTLYTALTFLGDLPQETALAALEKQIQTLEADLADRQSGFELKAKGQELPHYAQMLFANLADHYRLHLQFLKDLHSRLLKTKPHSLEFPPLQEE